MIFSLTMFAPDTSLKSFQKQQINVGLAGVLLSRAQNPRWVSFCFYFCILISVWQSPEMSIHMQREVSFPFPTPKIMRCHLFTANRHERLPQWSCVRAGALTPLCPTQTHRDKTDASTTMPAPYRCTASPLLVSPAKRREFIQTLLPQSSAEPDKAEICLVLLFIIPQISLFATS